MGKKRTKKPKHTEKAVSITPQAAKAILEATPVAAASVTAVSVTAVSVAAAPMAAPVTAASVEAAPEKATLVAATPEEEVRVDAVSVEAVPVDAVPVKAVPAEAPEGATPEEEVPVKAFPEEAAPEEANTASEEATFEDAIHEEATLEKAIHEGTTFGGATPVVAASAVAAVPEEATPVAAASEKAASEKAASEKAASEKAASEKAASEKAASEKATHEEAIMPAAVEGTFEEATIVPAAAKAIPEEATTVAGASVAAAPKEATFEDATHEKATLEEATLVIVASAVAAVPEEATPVAAASEKAASEETTHEETIVPAAAEATFEEATIVPAAAKAIPEEATSEDAIHEKATLEEATPVAAASEKAASEEATHEETIVPAAVEAIPEEATSGDAIHEEETLEEATPVAAASEKAASEEATHEETVVPAAFEAIPEEETSGDAIHEEATLEEATPEAAASEKAAPEEATPEEATHEGATIMPAAAEAISQEATPEEEVPVETAPEVSTSSAAATSEEATCVEATPVTVAPEEATTERATPLAAAPAVFPSPLLVAEPLQIHDTLDDSRIAKRMTIRGQTGMFFEYHFPDFAVPPDQRPAGNEETSPFVRSLQLVSQGYARHGHSSWECIINGRLGKFILDEVQPQENPGSSEQSEQAGSPDAHFCGPNCSSCSTKSEETQSKLGSEAYSSAIGSDPESEYESESEYEDEELLAVPHREAVPEDNKELPELPCAQYDSTPLLARETSDDYFMTDSEHSATDDDEASARLEVKIIRWHADPKIRAKQEPLSLEHHFIVSAGLGTASKYAFTPPTWARLRPSFDKTMKFNPTQDMLFIDDIAACGAESFDEILKHRMDLLVSKRMGMILNFDNVTWLYRTGIIVVNLTDVETFKSFAKHKNPYKELAVSYERMAGNEIHYLPPWLGNFIDVHMDHDKTLLQLKCEKGATDISLELPEDFPSAEKDLLFMPSQDWCGVEKESSKSVIRFMEKDETSAEEVMKERSVNLGGDMGRYLREMMLRSGVNQINFGGSPPPPEPGKIHLHITEKVSIE